MGRKDDFPKTVIRSLRERVGFQCSHPDCRVPTSGPGEGELEVAHFGRASHITAASRGGPRYDETLTSAERRSINNAIWLCANHADEIDDRESRYRPELLREWKRHAEAEADAEKESHGRIAMTGRNCWLLHSPANLQAWPSRR